MIIYKTKDQPPTIKVTSPIKEVIDHLNQVAGTSFNCKAKGNIQYISGRLSEGYTVDDLKLVVDIKTKEWIDKPDMRKYVRPATLFAPTKFDGYLSEAKMKPAGNKMYELLKDEWDD